MGLVWSYIGITDHEDRIRSLERIVIELERKTKYLEDRIDRAEMEFEWDDENTLYDPKKVQDLQIDMTPGSKLYEELDKYRDRETFMEAKGFTTRDELEMYIESNIRLGRKYVFDITHDGYLYRREFFDKEEANSFEKRLSAWIKKALIL